MPITQVAMMRRKGHYGLIENNISNILNKETIRITGYET